MTKATKAAKPPAHPLMLDGKSWDRQKVMPIVCEKITTTTKGLRDILADGHDGNTLPSIRMFMEWLAEDSALAHQYARAHETRAENLAGEIITLSDEDPRLDPESGKVDSAWVSHQKNRVDARKWLASKLLPKKYGDRLNLDAEVKVSELTDEQLMMRAADLAKQLREAGIEIPER